MLRKIVLAGAFAVLLTGVAEAQMPMPGISLGNGPKQLTPDEQAKQKAIDEAYRAASKKIPDKNAPDDPWASVRPNPYAAAKNKQ
jgi:hypothetical protein